MNDCSMNWWVDGLIKMDGGHRRQIRSRWLNGWFYEHSNGWVDVPKKIFSQYSKQVNGRISEWMDLCGHGWMD